MSTGERLGWSIAVEGDRIVAERTQDGDYLGLYVLDRDIDGTWNRTAALEPLRYPRSTVLTNVVIDGEDILAGVSSLYHLGRIERHSPDGHNDWSGGAIRPPSTFGQELFAHSFAVSGDQLIASSPQGQTLYAYNPCDAQWTGADLPDCTITPPGAEAPLDVQHTVSCLAGRGRVDTNIVNRSVFSRIVTPEDRFGRFIGEVGPARYRIEFQGLSVRERTVQPGDWWRMPVTGRSDGDYQVVVQRDGEIVSDRIVRVRCATPTPELTGHVIEVVNGCRGEPGERNGYLLFQFVNATPNERKWIIEFDDGSVPNRSTSAGPWAQSVRAVTGRADGTYPVSIRIDDVLYETFDITVNCDEVPQVELSTEVECGEDGHGRIVATAVNRSTQPFNLALVVTPGGFTSVPTEPDGSVVLTSSLEPDGAAIEVRAHADAVQFALLDQLTTQIDCP